MIRYLKIDENRIDREVQDFSDFFSPGDLVWMNESSEKVEFSQYPEIQSCIVSLDPKDGKILALVGGYDFYSSNFTHHEWKQIDFKDCYKWTYKAIDYAIEKRII